MGLFKSADDKLQEEIFNLRMTSKNPKTPKPQNPKTPICIFCNFDLVQM